MIVCEVPDCNRHARFFMCWQNESGKHEGLVCATCDKRIGRRNLMDAGMPMSEIIHFERYLKETESNDNPPDWPKWLAQRAQMDATRLIQLKVEVSYRDVPISRLDLSSATYNALRRRDILTSTELLSLTETQLYNIRTLGPARIEEIKKALVELRE